MQHAIAALQQIAADRERRASGTCAVAALDVQARVANLAEGARLKCEQRPEGAFAQALKVANTRKLTIVSVVPVPTGSIVVVHTQA